MHPRAPSADAPHPAVPPAPPAPCKGADQHQQLSWQPLHAQRCSTPHHDNDPEHVLLDNDPQRRARHRNPPLSNDLATDRPNHPTTQTIEPPNHPITQTPHRRTWFWSWFFHSEIICFCFVPPGDPPRRASPQSDAADDLPSGRRTSTSHPTAHITLRAPPGTYALRAAPSPLTSARHSQTLCRRDPDNAHHHPTTTKSPNHPHHRTSMRQGATSASGGNFRVLGSVSC